MTKIYRQTIIFLLYKLVGMSMIPTNVMIKKGKKNIIMRTHNDSWYLIKFIFTLCLKYGKIGLCKGIYKFVTLWQNINMPLKNLDIQILFLLFHFFISPYWLISIFPNHFELLFYFSLNYCFIYYIEFVFQISWSHWILIGWLQVKVVNFW
jgi:hypothetical protein